MHFECKTNEVNVTVTINESIIAKLKLAEGNKSTLYLINEELLRRKAEAETEA